MSGPHYMKTKYVAIVITRTKAGLSHTKTYKNMINIIGVWLKDKNHWVIYEETLIGKGVTRATLELWSST